MQVLYRIPQTEVGNDSAPYVKWSKDAKYLGCFGNNNLVLVFDRNGNKVSSIPVANPKFLEWDSQSKYLIITSSTAKEVNVFSMTKRDTIPIEAPFVPSWIQCSRNGSHIVAGSDKGKFWICNLVSKESQTYQGTHDDTIIDGCWNSKSQLALCSHDLSISISNPDGSVIARKDIKDIPIFPQFVTHEKSSTLVFCSLNNPNLFFWEYTNEDKVSKVGFEASYGKIVKCNTLSNMYVYIQFSTGKYALVGFDGKIAVERQAFSATAAKADSVRSKSVVCAGNSMKLLSMDDPKTISEEQVVFSNDFPGDAISVSLTSDGTICAVGQKGGSILVYLVEVPILSFSSGPLAIYNENLTTMSIYDMHKKNYRKFSVESQPQKLAICREKAAVAFNNKCHFYSTKTCEFITSVEFSASIDSIQVSETTYAVLMSGRVVLHYFDQSKRPFNFPDFETNTKVTAFALTGILLLLATDDGAIRIFDTRSQAYLDGYKHPVAVKTIRSNLSETRFVFIDVSNDVYLFNPIKKTTLEVSNKGDVMEADYALFDVTDRNVFAVIASKAVSVYHFTDHDVSGSKMSLLSTTSVPSMKSALGLTNGTLIFLDSRSTEQQQVLSSHTNIAIESAEGVQQLLNLHRFRTALQFAQKIGDKALLKHVGEAALAALAVEIASEAFSLSGEASMYNVLSPIKKEEEYSYLRGYISMLNHDFNSAQKSFLESSRPQTALDMRAALLQFDHALKLADNLDPSRIPQLSLDSARQNELVGKYSDAIQLYKVSLKSKPHQKPSRDGIIRCLILSGKVEQGMKQLEKIHDQRLILECARILERLLAYVPAAQLFSQLKQYNSAAQCYLRAGELKSASDLIPYVDDSKVLRSMGKNLEKSGQLESAAKAFERANDWEPLVRVLLKVNFDQATSIAREHPTATTCRQVADHCVKLGNFRYAIEFFIISGHADDAFRLAELHERMEELAELIGDKGTQAQYEAIGTYFSAQNQLITAAKFYGKANSYERAMECYMMDGGDEALDGALELAESNKDKDLRESLLNYLTSSMKERPGDLKYLLRMFIIMQQFEEAAATAVKISDDFRSRGEYKPARELLFDIVIQLKKHNVVVSSEMRTNLMILHSYLLIKQVRDRNKIHSALLLRRVSRFISKFPAHAPTILTNTVAECSRVGMKRSAFECARKLVSPEYENKLPPDLMKRIMATIRHKDTSEIEEEKSPCPICGFDLPISELQCSNCKSHIPFDSLTGMHMKKDDWCECPHCHFPASHSIMAEVKECPLCNTPVPVPELVSNPKIT